MEIAEAIEAEALGLDQITGFDTVETVVGIIGTIMIASVLGGGGTALLLTGPIGLLDGSAGNA